MITSSPYRTVQSLVFCVTLFFLCANTSAEKQFDLVGGYLSLNDYVGAYPYVPFAATYGVTYLEDPDLISQNVGLNAIDVQLRYLDNEEKTYYEYEHKEEGKKSKGNLFLKRTEGHLYQIVEAKFVSYQEAAESAASAAESAASAAESAASAAPSTADPVVPNIEDAEQGVTIFVDLALLDENARKERLYRYDAYRRLQFFEYYAYTSKGALQRLIRSYSDGTKERFIYYFSTGGLKEIYNQNKDGSSRVFRYSVSGDLSEKQIRDKEDALVSDERNKYSSKGKLLQKVEVFYHEKRYIKKQYRDGKLYKQQNFELNKDSVDVTVLAGASSGSEGSSKEDVQSFLLQDSVLGPLPSESQISLLYEEEFRYDQEGNTTESQSNSLLSENETVLRYDNEGVLEKEQFFKGGQLEREIEYSSKKERKELYYYEGKEVLRILYKDNSKVREEVLQDGEVIEVRE